MKTVLDPINNREILQVPKLRMNMFGVVFKKVPSGSNIGNGLKDEERLEAGRQGEK